MDSYFCNILNKIKVLLTLFRTFNYQWIKILEKRPKSAMQSGENGQQGSAFHDEPHDDDKGMCI